ncbi:MAG: glycosidase, partial [Pedobacter sp.]
MTSTFKNRVELLRKAQQALINRKNQIEEQGNGVFDRYTYPVLTAAHVPLEWKYDFDPDANPYFMERIGVNAV